jgi:hypothetical protein
LRGTRAGYGTVIPFVPLTTALIAAQAVRACARPTLIQYESAAR